MAARFTPSIHAPEALIRTSQPMRNVSPLRVSRSSTSLPETPVKAIWFSAMLAGWAAMPSSASSTTSRSGETIQAS